MLRQKGKETLITTSLWQAVLSIMKSIVKWSQTTDENKFIFAKIDSVLNFFRIRNMTSKNDCPLTMNN